MEHLDMVSAVYVSTSGGLEVTVRKGNDVQGQEIQSAVVKSVEPYETLASYWQVRLESGTPLAYVGTTPVA